MKIVVQRVKEASVAVEGKIVGEISQGLLLLIGVDESDTQEDANWLIKKVVDLRIFSDSEGKMNRHNRPGRSGACRHTGTSGPPLQRATGPGRRL